MFEAVLPLSPAACFTEFIDLESARLWLPGLKKMRVVHPRVHDRLRSSRAKSRDPVLVEGPCRGSVILSA